MKWIISTVLTLCIVSLAEAKQLYWTDQATGKIQRSEVDGSNVVDLVTGLGGPHSLAYHASSGKLYWSDPTDDVIMRANLDGSNVETVLATGDPRGIAIDPIANKLYFSRGTPTQIQRSNLDGSGVELLWDAPASPAYAPFNLEIDVANDTIYFTEDNIETIFSSDLEFTGSNPTIIVSSAGHPVGISLDNTADKLYWTDDDGGNIYRSNTDGSGDEIILSGFVKLSGIEVLGDDGVMYVSDDGADTIYKLNLDGTGLTPVVTSVPFAFDLMVVPEPSSVVLMLIGVVGLLAWKRIAEAPTGNHKLR